MVNRTLLPGDQGIERLVFTYVFLLDSLLNVCYTE